MARIPQVTRTIKATNATVLVANVQTKQTETLEVVLPRTYKDEADMLKTAQKLYTTEVIKVVAIEKFEVVEKHYAMLETEFVKLAKVIDEKED